MGWASCGAAAWWRVWVNDEMRARVAASRAAQGLAPVVEDLAVLERVASVFRLVGGDEPERLDAAA
ncbi:hypothetical protein Sme01_61060 [Sphaerisporangium melleum]|uniref:Uncharacterized protein n=1 Tax=Sphaerisporangium melleum TaxID=321316 RepID=A0A917RC33_9ACTN|nr:hypothetical protein GCM10007964_47260 [Sphaerisporangium melleum]GII73630.1 hypothetical protein Sme01_61060 [Sphaerisporangium melleum]